VFALLRPDHQHLTEATMKQLWTQLDARMQRAASCLDAAYGAMVSWSSAFARSMDTAVNAKPGFVAIRTATDVHARRPQEPSP
jgi:hypothetical protein